MRPYTNKTDRVDERKCLFSAIRNDNRARKKAARKLGTLQIEQE